MDKVYFRRVYSKRQLILFGKFFLFLLLVYVLYDQFFVAREFSVLWQYFKQQLDWNRFPFLLVAFLLMPVNWILETWKWKVLLKSKTKFGQLIKGVSAGVTFGFITPGRMGEFVGRTFYLDDANKTNVFFLSTLGGLAQTAVTLVAGSVMFSLSHFYQPFYAGLAIGLTAVFLLLYFRFDVLNQRLRQIPFLAVRNLVMTQAEIPTMAVLLKVLLLSALRYFVYISQYVLLLLFVGISLDVFLLYMNNALVLLLQTFSPLIPYLDFTYRGSVALFIFAPYTENKIAVFVAVTLVWLINLVLPAIIGYIFIWKNKFQTPNHKTDAV